jgi:hypothetical protein
VDDWMHWVAVAGANRNGVALFDPSAAEIAALVRPETLRRRWAHTKKEDGGADPHFFFIAIRPRVRRQHPKGIADNDLVHDLRRREDLREDWDRYLKDLIAIFGRRPSRAEGCYPAWRFIARNAGLVTTTVSDWDGEVPKRFYQTELKNLALVCRAYNFTLRPREEHRALLSLACILNRQAHEP